MLFREWLSPVFAQFPQNSPVSNLSKSENNLSPKALSARAPSTVFTFISARALDHLLEHARDVGLIDRAVTPVKVGAGVRASINTI